jgi:hypothetical protein
MYGRASAEDQLQSLCCCERLCHAKTWHQIGKDTHALQGKLSLEPTAEPHSTVTPDHTIIHCAHDRHNKSNPAAHNAQETAEFVCASLTLSEFQRPCACPFANIGADEMAALDCDACRGVSKSLPGGYS